MANKAIEVEHLTKIYRLYHSPKMDRLRELVSPSRKKYHHDLYALKDVSFSVDKGETVGIIGQNGSGKSTLLKIICGVARPTSGRVTVNGRISSLLELGAGFHPEFTGKENVYMNGALMGLSRAEIDRRFPEVEAFADIGEFIDQPVKTYSSGMFVRLAFAAAVNVDPEILVIDEALAVGDMQFQRQCMRRMEEFRSKHKTMFIVSHNLYTIRAFCRICIWMRHGQVVAYGEPDDIVNRYIHYTSDKDVVGFQKERNDTRPLGPGIDDVKVTGAKLFDSRGNERNIFKTGDSLILEITYSAREKAIKPTFGYSICTKGDKLNRIRSTGHHSTDQIRVTSYSTKWEGCSPSYIIGKGIVRVRLDAIPLLPGYYSILFAIRDEYDLVPYDVIEDIVSFQILEGDDKTGILGTCGLLYYPSKWEFSEVVDGQQTSDLSD